jgi:RNA polymerase sigma-70 factor (ECF subfamily)
MNKAQLLQRSQSGENAAIQALVETYQSDVLRLARSILDDPNDAEEAMQEAFVTAFNALDSYRGEASFKTWLFSITINVCRRRLRKRKAQERLMRAVQMLFWVGAGPAHPEEVVIRREARTKLRDAIDALDEKHRLPILLYYNQDLPVAEIAQVLNLPVGTVLSRLYTARERLRMALIDDLDSLM